MCARVCLSATAAVAVLVLAAAAQESWHAGYNANEYSYETHGIVWAGRLGSVLRVVGVDGRGGICRVGPPYTCMYIAALSPPTGPLGEGAARITSMVQLRSGVELRLLAPGAYALTSSVLSFQPCVTAFDGSITCTRVDVPLDAGLEVVLDPMSLMIDDLTARVLVVATERTLQTPVLVSCSLDLTGCLTVNLAAGTDQNRDCGLQPSALVSPASPASAQLLVITRNFANANSPSLFRCTLDGARCVHLNLVASVRAALVPGQYGISPAATLDSVSDRNIPKLLVVTIRIVASNVARTSTDGGVSLFRCSIDGATCTHADLSAGLALAFSAPKATVDASTLHLLVVANALNFTMALFRCPLEGAGCSFVTAPGFNSITTGSGRFPFAYVDAPSSSLFLFAENEALLSRVRCAPNGTQCNALAHVFGPLERSQLQAPTLLVHAPSASLLAVACDLATWPLVLRCPLGFSWTDCTSRSLVDEAGVVSNGNRVGAVNVVALVDPSSDGLLVVTCATVDSGDYHPVAFQCAIDGSACSVTDLAARVGVATNTLICSQPTALIEPGTGALLVVWVNSDLPYLIRCAATLANCTVADLTDGTGQSAMPALKLSAVFDPIGSKILVVTQQPNTASLSLFRCASNGTACTYSNLSAALTGLPDESPPIALYDSVRARLLVVVVREMVDYCPVLMQCLPDGSACNTTNVCSLTSLEFKKSLVGAVLDASASSVCVFTAREVYGSTASSLGVPVLVCCTTDGSTCDAHDLGSFVPADALPDAAGTTAVSAALVPGGLAFVLSGVTNRLLFGALRPGCRASFVNATGVTTSVHAVAGEPLAVALDWHGLADPALLCTPPPPLTMRCDSLGMAEQPLTVPPISELGLVATAAFVPRVASRAGEAHTCLVRQSDATAALTVPVRVSPGPAVSASLTSALVSQTPGQVAVAVLDMDGNVRTPRTDYVSVAFTFANGESTARVGLAQSALTVTPTAQGSVFADVLVNGVAVSVVAQAAPRVCAPGQRRSGETCPACAANSFSNASVALCTECPLGTATPESLVSQDVGASSVANCSCVPGTYRLTAPEAGLACTVCPVRATCAGGQAVPQAQPGFLALPGRPDALAECPRPASCPGGTGCATGYTGLLCKDCAAGFYVSETGECLPCPAARDGLVSSYVLLLIGLAVAASAIAFIALSRRTAEGTQTATQLLRKRGLPPTIGMSVAVFQVMGVLGNASLGWSRSSQRALAGFSAFSLDVSLFSSPCSTGSVSASYAISILTPVGVIALIAAVWLVRRLIGRWHPVSPGELASAVLCFAGPLAYLPLSRAALALFACTPLPDGRYYMTTNLSFECYATSQWQSLLPLGLFGIGAYVIGIPASLGVLMFRQRARLFTDAGTVRALGGVYKLFRTRMVFVPIALMGKKLAIALISLVLVRVPIVQGLLFLLVVLVGGSVQTRLAPFYFPLYNRFDSMLGVGLSVVLVSTIPQTSGGALSSGVSAFLAFVFWTGFVGLLVVVVANVVVDLRDIIADRRAAKSGVHRAAPPALAMAAFVRLFAADLSDPNRLTQAIAAK